MQRNPIIDSSWCLRYFKVLVAVLLTVGCVASFAGCGSSQSAMPEPTPSNVTVGFVGIGSTQGEWAASSEKRTVAGLRSSGFTVKYFKATSLDPQRQVNAVTNFVKQKVSAIVITPQSTNMWTDTLVSVRHAGIPVILLGQKPVSVKAYLYDSYIGPSGFSVGRKLADWVTNTAKITQADSAGQLKTLYFQAPLVSSFSSDVLHAYKAASTALGDGVTAVVGSWDTQKATAIVKKAMNPFSTSGTSEDFPDIVIAGNSEMAQAVEKAAKEKGISLSDVPQKGSICVLGIGAETSGDSVSSSVTWNGDYAERLGTTITTLVAGGSVQKDDAVTLTETDPRGDRSIG
ncbi:MAG: substrate-binding domain-containing protein [Bifidobacteriaceae bacterium]|jgi:ABC-type sugar transport system substrate-binding protein|nr:substrate-binding domain-containing protein [Bifidobacteriaceae bacterium]MCI1978781.1 substrate-binding domain-containing protein [Bifidobacteriaceae bacterium]